VKALVIDTFFLQILDYPVKAGASNVFRSEDALITEAFAEKIFGKDDPVGKTFSYPAIQKTLTVAGVIRTPTNKSVLSFDLLIASQLSQHWSRMPNSLILLHPGSDYREINRQYDQFMEMKAWGEAIRFQLFPWKDVYFDRQVTSYSGFTHGNLTYVFILLSVGVLLLLVGLSNYLNIQSVVMTRRNRELGMKKVFGAEGYKIFLQLMLENLTLTVLALALAFGLASALHPFVENILDLRQYTHLRFDAGLTLVLLLALPTVASIPPFLRYRYFSPVRSLRAVNRGSNPLLARKFFLCFQYFLTMGLIAVSLFFVKQLHFMLNKDLGFRTQNMIEVPFLKSSYTIYDSRPQEEANQQREKRKAIADELKQRLDASPLLEYWNYGSFPVSDRPPRFGFKVPGSEMQNTILMGADETWFKLFEVRLIDGKLWDNNSDNFYSYNLIVTESTLRQFGITDYREAELEPSRRIWWTSDRPEEMKTNPPYRIVGVIQDIYPMHLSWKAEPVIFYFTSGHEDDPVIASFAPENRQEVLRFMKELYDELIGGEFTYSFIEDEIAKLYREDRKLSILCSSFTGIAILVSLLGLLGVSLFDIRQRRKEIAIRKVNGALMKDIIRLLLKKYFALLGIAFAVATPVALFVIHKYLENFTFKAPVSWWLFAVALLVTVVLSMLTLLGQASKASRENPADVIKSD
jgi:ABC-type antimicrobial peptide transport system permease subunit